MIKVISKDQQGYGAFNGGEIVENKPIGFPQDHSQVRPYSNLFYWAHARAVKDSTIGLHPHQGFEICSFVLKGSIRHYDTKLKEWRPLSAGDVQIIRAGSGISHSEFIAKDGEIFQIWFDPNLQVTLDQPATYDDYKADVFPVLSAEDVNITTLVGEGSPFQMQTPGVRVHRYELNGNAHTLQANPASVYSAYILEGSMQVDATAVQTTDFVIIENQDSITLQSEGPASVFIIESPAQPGYRTYSQLMRR